MKLTPSPVKQLALDLGVPVAQPRSLRLDGKFPDEAEAGRAALQAANADVLVVAARTSGKASEKNGITLFLVPGNASGLKRTKLKSVDSRGVANLEFKDVEVPASAVLGSVDAGFDVLDATLDRARAGLAAEMLGTAMQEFDVTLDYLKTRAPFVAAGL